MAPQNADGHQGPVSTNIWRDPRTGVYQWRRTHRITGRRFRRSTGSKVLRIALRRVQQFEEEHEREAAGLTSYRDYRRPLSEFVEPFLESLVCGEMRVGLMRMRLRRAFDRLRLEVLADLENFVEIEKRLLRLEGKGFTRRTLVDGFQVALKQFSRYLASRREIELDHLAPWAKLRVDDPERVRRALTPDEMARALAASDCLDAYGMIAEPMRPVWTALLVSAARVSSLAALDVADLDLQDARLLLKGNGNKRAGALDEATLSDIVDYAEGRDEGPLFLSRKGKRIGRCRSLKKWRASVSLAAVDLEWPQGEVRDLRMEYFVHNALTHNRITVAMGGPQTGAHRPGPMKRAERTRLIREIARIADKLRPAWQERMKGVDQHCLRMTHRTWALATGVPEVLIDRQLGHTSPAGNAALNAAWSIVGRTHYTDMNFLTLDARRSAEAVREILEKAEATLLDIVARRQSALVEPDERGRPGVVAVAAR